MRLNNTFATSAIPIPFAVLIPIPAFSFGFALPSYANLDPRNDNHHTQPKVIDVKANAELKKSSSKGTTICKIKHTVFSICKQMMASSILTSRIA